ncbi:MAG: chromate resistance protein [Symbiobacteriaceae bacterium]|nr:chromate resistance protein [Symbiobacteriaceae bacterium]
MIWTTWENIGIDRQACAWFIKRFFDPKAEFAFISREVALPDPEYGFDTPAARWTHKHGHSTFHMFVREHAPKDKTLKKMAEIIDGADTANDILPPPEAYGLEAICIGLRAISASDQEAIDRGALIFDGLYEYLRRRTGQSKP